MADEPEVGGEEKSKGSKLWILIAVLIFLVTGDLTFRAVSFFKGRQPAAAGVPEQAVGKDKAGAPTSNKKAEIKSTLSLDPFLVNLADKDEVRFVKATFQLGLTEEVGESTNRAPLSAAIRDAIITILTSKTAAQMLTPEGKDKLREEIRDRVNEAAPKMSVGEVYIVDFVVQL